MQTLTKYVCLFLLCFMAGFSVLAQGSLVWQKVVPKDRDQSLSAVVESHNKKFLMAVGSESYRPNPTTPSIYTLVVVAFRPETGDTLYCKKLTTSYPQHYNVGVRGIFRAPNYHFWIVTEFDYRNPGSNIFNYGIGLLEIDSMGQVLQQRECLLTCDQIGLGRVQSMPDGGLLIAGFINNQISLCEEWDLFALRLDGNGDQVFYATYGLPYRQNITSVGLYPGNKLCIGYFQYEGNLLKNYMLFADATTGLFLYNRSFAYNPDILDARMWALRDGTFIVGAGKTNTGVGYAYGYLAHVDANFNLLWSRIDSLSRQYSYDIMKETTDGAFVIIGERQIGLSTKRRFMSKVKIDTGEELWRKYFNDTINDTRGTPYDLCVTQSNEVYGVGVGFIISNPVINSDFFMARYTGVADFLQPSDYCTDSVRANFTGTWLQDTLRLHSISNSGMAYQNSLDYQWIINGVTVSLDSAFQQIKSSADYPQGLPVTLVITNFWGCKDTLTAKVTPQGIVGNRPVVETLHATSLQNARPNPSTQNVTIGYKLPANTKEAVLRVYELGTGRTVAERNLSALEADTQFNVSHWATGVYAYQLFVNGAPVAVKQLVVSR